jgi:hypothetical protein
MRVARAERFIVSFPQAAKSQRMTGIITDRFLRGNSFHPSNACCIVLMTHSLFSAKSVEREAENRAEAVKIIDPGPCGLYG